ncbi:hypothetical protein [Streptomyces sp. NPDC093589]|uniref:hypothetical protein n=1 Tax=Streptomyces sp. NPDC093589 TaxID=3366043 RepID=UPI00381B0EAD
MVKDEQTKRVQRALQHAFRALLPKTRRPQLTVGEARTGKTSTLAATRAQLDSAGIPYEERHTEGWVTLQLAATPTAYTPASRSTQPRPMDACELASWKCPDPDCGRTAAKGTHHWDDRGPYQLLSNHALECPNGHRWRNSTDGG